MSSYTDPLRLNEKRLFQDLKENLSEKIEDTRNILEIRDNVLYVWNAKEKYLGTVNLAVPGGEADEDRRYQKLRPTNVIRFTVKNVMINDTGTQVALWGNVGLQVMELPERWGKESMFEGGKEEILCKTHRFDCFDTTRWIRKARWHPGALDDSYILILTSQNTFYSYMCKLGDNPRLVKHWAFDRKPFSSPSKIPDYSSLGDTAVDFDFATPTLRKPETFVGKDVHKNVAAWEQIEWPILLLRGNGEVLVMHNNVFQDDYENPVVSEPLSMYPPAYDNYGIDTCSILCVQTTPPIVVIATCSGKIYHAILLRDESNDKEDDINRSWSEYGTMYNVQKPVDALYVYECVEIELGFCFADTDEKYNCPIHLRCDKDNKSRYFCSHNAGIHMVCLPMVYQLEEYINAPEKNNDAHLPSLSHQSSSQYLICSRTNHTNASDVTPILGFGLFQEPCMLVALLHTGNVVARSVIDLYYFPNIDPPETIASTEERVNEEAFDVYIKRLLSRETSQPIIKIGSQSMSTRECLQLLYHATEVFRKEHFVRHDNVRKEIGKRVHALKVMKAHLLKELDTLNEAKKKLRQTAERLAERYDDIKVEQEKLAQRAKEVLRLVNYKEPLMTSIERAEAEEVRKMAMKIEKMGIRLLELKNKTEQQTEYNNECNERRKEVVFRSDQENTMKNHFASMAKDLEKLIADVKTFEKEVSI